MDPRENVVPPETSIPPGNESDDEDGWQDIDNDEEPDQVFVSLFDDKQFKSVADTFEYCKEQYSFDIWSLRDQHDLDFFGLVKLVNYVRQAVRDGDNLPNLSSNAAFENDIYLKPVLEDDAVLYNLEEILQSRSESANLVEDLQTELASLQARFDAYRVDVSKYLDEKLEEQLTEPAETINGKLQSNGRIKNEEDDGYFLSYSYNAIHETMLKDKVRTDAYRDFVYENKDLFQGKTVLDVGCGTGILSMFCAKAGAKAVIAVDNSAIIDTTRKIIKDNGLEHVISCVRGQIEEVSLPVENVDIIISEWMGYCLLFESMLDSVLHARDKYLAKGGLLVPSHATIQIAALADTDLRTSHIDFWKDVYGFDMSHMVGRAEEEGLIRVIPQSDLASDPVAAIRLDLHSTTVNDLDFETPFAITLMKDVEAFEGFAIWFDIDFMRHSTQEGDILAQAGTKKFSTGPYTEPTHWQQGALLIETPIAALRRGQSLNGRLAFLKKQGERRSIEIVVTWKVDNGEFRSQKWSIV